MGYVLLIIIVIVVGIFIEWQIGKAIGKSISRNTGIILGIVLIVLFPLFLTGIAIIVYSNRNESTLNVNVNLGDSNENLIRSANDGNIYNSYRQNNVSVSKYERKHEPKITQKSTQEDQDFCITLLKNDLYQYIPIFKENKLESTSIVKDLSEQDLEKIGINVMGDRKKIIQLIENIDKVNENGEYEENIYNEDIQFKAIENTYIYEENNFVSKKLMELHKNDIILVIGEIGSWCLVKLENNITGYVYSKSIELVQKSNTKSNALEKKIIYDKVYNDTWYCSNCLTENKTYNPNCKKCGKEFLPLE